MIRKGFTLIETLMVIILVGIISFVFAIYIREGFSAWEFLSGQKSMTLSTRAALNRVVKELKRVKQSTNIITHTSKEVSFIDVDNNVVTFSQSGTNLLRGPDILLKNLRDPCGLQFTYLDKNGNQTAITNDMRVVRCLLTVVKGENKFVVESAARIRVRRIR
ncbi:MAG: type II secretion system protein [Candidatus Margulisiibacteriota bacterium]